MIEGTPAITITLPILKPGAPDTLLRNEIRAPGETRHARRRGAHCRFDTGATSKLAELLRAVAASPLEV
jgi:hypothetical protein